MLRIFLIFIWIYGIVLAEDIQKIFSRNIALENNIVFLKTSGDKLLVGTDFGEVLSIDTKTLVKELVIQLPSVTSFTLEAYMPKVYGVDKIGEKWLILSDGDYGTKNLFLLQSGVLERLKTMESLNIKKAAFVDSNTIFLGLASNEIMLVDLKTQKAYYRKQLSEASFSDFALDLEKGYYAISCESGIVYYGEIASGVVLQELDGVNKDRVYQVQMARNGKKVTLITGGQDRKVGIYQIDVENNVNTFYTLLADFLVYSVGLSSDGSIGAYMQNEESDIVVFNTQTHNKIALLKGHAVTLNAIIFLDSTHLVSSEDGKNILLWEVGNAK